MTKKTEAKIVDNRLDKIFMSQIDSLLDKTILCDIGDEEIEIKVSHLIPIDNAMNMTTVVTEALFVDGEYIPYRYKPVYAMAILNYYTDLGADIDNDHMTNLIYQTNIVDQIIACISASQLSDIDDAICKSIEFKIRKIMSSHEKQLEENLTQMHTIIEMASQFMELFDGFDMDQVSNIYKKIGNISEEKIIEGVLASRK